MAAGVPPENVPVTFEETGTRGQTISYTLTAQATASYQCWNPQTQEIDTQRETVSRTVAAGINLTADADGSIRGTLQLAPPRPEKLSCRLGYSALAGVILAFVGVPVALGMSPIGSPIAVSEHSCAITRGGALQCWGDKANWETARPPIAPSRSR